MRTRAMPEVPHNVSKPIAESQYWAALGFAVGFAAIAQGMWWGVLIVGGLSVAWVLVTAYMGRKHDPSKAHSHTSNKLSSMGSRSSERRGTMSA